MGHFTGSKVKPFEDDGISTTPFVDDQFRVPVFFRVSKTGYEWQDCMVPGMVLPVNDESQGRVTGGKGSMTTLDEPDGPGIGVGEGVGVGVGVGVNSTRG